MPQQLSELAITLDQRALAEVIAHVLADDPAIEAAWLGGSLGRGAGDAFSDVDVIALVGEGSAAATGLRYAGEAARIAEPALVTPLYGGRVLSVVTADWRRFDISFVEAAELERYHRPRLVELFNRGERRPPDRVPPAYRATPASVLPLINEFLRVLGLLPVAAGRGEWLLSARGVDIMRGLLVDLMLEESGVGPAERGGALRRRPLLSDEQIRELDGLLPVAANRESVLAANVQLAALFLPRARRLAREVDAPWPEVFEAATRRYLQAQLGLMLEEAAPQPG